MEIYWLKYKGEIKMPWAKKKCFSPLRLGPLFILKVSLSLHFTDHVNPHTRVALPATFWCPTH